MAQQWQGPVASPGRDRLRVRRFGCGLVDAAAAADTARAGVNKRRRPLAAPAAMRRRPRSRLELASSRKQSRAPRRRHDCKSLGTRAQSEGQIDTHSSHGQSPATCMRTTERLLLFLTL